MGSILLKLLTKRVIEKAINAFLFLLSYLANDNTDNKVLEE